ncbi:MAG: hypothetical protein GY820_48170, partial [Gammaproteobacteria bacterium]|nr:hypothetical protein [Gammaproteobacteria bacterium]
MENKANNYNVDFPVQTAIKKIALDGISLADIQKASSTDQALQQVFHYLRTPWPHNNKIDAALRPYHLISTELSLEDGFLTRNDERIVMPAALQRRLLQLAHVAHPGIVRMKRKLRETYWWP